VSDASAYVTEFGLG